MPQPATDTEVKAPELKEALEAAFGPGGARGVVEEPPKPAAPPPPKDPPPAPAKAVAPAKSPVSRPAKPKATPRARQPEPTRIDLNERDRIVAEAAVRGAAEAEKRKGKEITDDLPTKADLSPKARQTLAVMDYLGKKDPRYATLAERTLEFMVKTEKEYVEKWKKDNEGKEFDPESDEHNEFYDKHQPQFDQDALDAARKEMDREEILSESQEALERRLRQERAVNDEHERRKTEAGQIQHESAMAMLRLIKGVLPEAEAIFLVGEVPNFTDEQWEKLAEEHPAVVDDLRDEAEFLQRKVTELERLERYPRTYPPDEKNRLHQAIAGKIIDAEEQIMALPPKDQLHDGRKFIPQSEYARLRHKIMVDKGMQDGEKREALRKLSDSHWLLTNDIVKSLIIDQHKVRAQKIISRANKIVERLKKRTSPPAGDAPRGPAAPAPAVGAPAPAKEPTPAPPKRATPPDRGPSASGVDIMPTGDHGGGSGESALEVLEKIGM